MKLTDLHLAIMNRDDCSHEDAHHLVTEMRSEVHEQQRDPEDVLFGEGFEPDYVFDLL